MKKLLLLPALALVLASCSDDDNKGNTLEMSYNNCFNYVTDRQTGTPYVDDETSYKMFFDFDNRTATIDILSLNLSEDASAVNLRLEGLPLQYGGSTYTVSVPSVAAQNDITLTDFRFELLDRAVFRQGVGWFASPVALVSFKASKGDDSYAVTTYMRRYVYVDNGTTVTGGDEPFTNSGTYYEVALDPKKGTASIFIDGPRFAPGMPSTLRMTYPEIPLTFTAGGFALAKADLIPTLPDGDKQVEAPSYKISDLTATAALDKGMNLDYKCTMQPKNSPVEITYTVNTVLGYTYKE